MRFVGPLSLAISIATLLLVGSIAVRPQEEVRDVSYDLADLDARLDEVEELLRGVEAELRGVEESIGSSTPYGGDPTGLYAAIDRIGLAAGPLASEADVEEVREMLQTTNAILSDICFRMEAC